MNRILLIITVILILFFTSAFAQNWSLIHDFGSRLGGCYSICFVDTLIGYRATMLRINNMYRSEDGGHTFDRVNLNLPRNTIYEIHFLNPDIGFIADYTINATFDGGDNWEMVANLWDYDCAINDMFFINDTVGWAVGGITYIAPDTSGYSNHIILQTIDGGINWEVQLYEHNLREGAPFTEVAFSDADHGLAVGNQWSFYRTEDGGENWDVLEKPDIMRYGNSIQPMDAVVHIVEETFL